MGKPEPSEQQELGKMKFHASQFVCSGPSGSGVSWDDTGPRPGWSQSQGDVMLLLLALWLSAACEVPCLPAALASWQRGSAALLEAGMFWESG